MYLTGGVSYPNPHVKPPHQDTTCSKHVMGPQYGTPTPTDSVKYTVNTNNVGGPTYLDVWVLFLQVPPSTCDSSPSTHTTDQHINLALSGIPDLRPCGLIMDAWVVGVLKLLQDEAVWCVGSNLLRLLNSTLWNSNSRSSWCHCREYCDAMMDMGVGNITMWEKVRDAYQKTHSAVTTLG